MNHPLDEEIASLIAQLLPLLRERGIRHTSLFSDVPTRVYMSHGPYNRETQAQGNTVAECFEALDAAIDDKRLLETLY